MQEKSSQKYKTLGALRAPNLLQVSILCPLGPVLSTIPNKQKVWESYCQTYRLHELRSNHLTRTSSASEGCRTLTFILCSDRLNPNMTLKQFSRNNPIWVV